MCTQSLLLTFWRRGFSSKMMECFSGKYKSAKTESDDDWCYNLWKEVERNFLKLNLSSEKFSKRSFFWIREMFFQKKVDTFLKNTLKNLGSGTFRFLNFAIRSRQDDENGTLNNKSEQLWVTNVSEKIP